VVVRFVRRLVLVGGLSLASLPAVYFYGSFCLFNLYEEEFNDPAVTKGIHSLMKL